MSFISEKSKKIPGSMIREMFAMQDGMTDVISFALGEPDFTAQHAHRRDWLASRQGLMTTTRASRLGAGGV